VVGQTGEFERAHARLLAGDVAEAARLDGPAVRSTEFQNYRGESRTPAGVLAGTRSGAGPFRFSVDR
jgi:hypothetical protein